MTTTLPTTIGGYQHLAPDVICQEGDIFVEHGKPMGLVVYCIGMPIGRIEHGTGWNIYRKLPVAKPGDTDTAWKDVAAAITLPTDARARKAVPIYSGFIKYFPRAIAAVAHLSKVGNDQHNPGRALHWDRSKSGDELDALMRHLLEADGVDNDGVDHLCKVAWRSMAALEKRLEKQEASQ